MPSYPATPTTSLSRLPLAVLLLLTALAGSVTSTSTKAAPVKDGNVSAELVADSSHIRPGETFTVALRLEMDPKWHTYWINAGDAGFPTSIEWTLPEGFTAGETQFPYPHRFEVDFGGILQVGLGYETQVFHLVEITPPSDLPAGTPIPLNAKVSWLMCDDKSCVPGGADLSLEMPVSDDPVSEGPHAALFAKYRKEMPVEDSSWSLSIEESGETDLLITLAPPEGAALPDLSSLSLYPETQNLIDLKTAQTFEAADGKLTLLLPKAEYFDQIPEPFAAVLISESGFDDFEGRKALRLTDTPLPPPADTRVDGPATPTKPPETEASESPPADNAPFGGGLLGYLVAGFIGGMILNIMPCVFPVISLKILSFVSHAGEDRRKALAHGLVYTLGILLFFVALAGIVTSLSIGWGGQFQSPVFVMIMAAVIFVLSLSLFGVFEFGLKLTSVGGGLTQSSGYGGSFWSGALAVILATPCTGPFLGTSLGWAFSQPPLVVFVFFVTMGLGMAAPYVLLTVFPALTNRLPRPGPWMETFKQVMGFPMIAAVVYMLWILEGQIGDKGQAWFMVALVFLGLAAWAWGRFAGPAAGEKKTAAYSTIAASLVVALGLSIFATKQKSSAAESTYSGETIAEVIEGHRAEGKHVFVDFTARWCAICQTNKPAMYSEETKALFEEYGVVFVVADWTNKSEDIFEVLQKYGRRSVPFYPLFPADPSKAPLELPQNLTNGIIRDYVEQLADIDSNFPVASK